MTRVLGLGESSVPVGVELGELTRSRRVLSFAPPRGRKGEQKDSEYPHGVLL